MPSGSRTGDIADRGRQIYERDLRDELERSHTGKFLALDVDSGEHEIGDTLLEASNRLRARLPDASIFGQLIGRNVTYRFGGRRPAQLP